MVRESLHLLRLDEANYGTAAWNPLGELISPGNRVLIKPNFVLHFNAGAGIEVQYEIGFDEDAVSGRNKLPKRVPSCRAVVRFVQSQEMKRLTNHFVNAV